MVALLLRPRSSFQFVDGKEAISYQGCLIGITLKSEVRYEGVIITFNLNSIAVSDARSFGTEGRIKDGPQILPDNIVHEFMQFHGRDIKDLQFKSSPPAQPNTPTSTDQAIQQPMDSSIQQPMPSFVLPPIPSSVSPRTSSVSPQTSSVESKI